MSLDHDAVGVLAPRPAMTYVPGWYDNVPAELKTLSQWVNWRYDFREGDERKPGKWTKAPVLVRSGRGQTAASTTDPLTWTTFEKAKTVVQLYGKHPEEGQRIDGLGFVFTEDDDLVGIDFDQAMKDGVIEPWAQEWLDRLSPTYTEVSPSGTGFKAFYRGHLPAKGKAGGRRRKGYGADGQGEIEIYCKARYFTVTGAILFEDHRTINAPTEGALEALVAEVDDRPGKHAKAEAAPRTPRAPNDLADDELLAKACNQGGGKGDEFRRLYYHGIHEGEDHSAADFSLVNDLAFWFGPNEQKLDQLFRGSALFRSKWADRTDYGPNTIRNVLNTRTAGYYDPGHQSSKPSANGNGHANGTAHAEVLEEEVGAQNDNGPIPEGPSSDVLERLSGYVLGKNAQGLYADTDLLNAIVLVKGSDPAVYAQMTALVLEHWKSGRLDNFTKTINRLAQKSRNDEDKGKGKGGKKPGLDAMVDGDGPRFSVRDGSLHVGMQPLANFEARIVEEVQRHEAGEVRRQYVIEATRAGGHVARAVVNARDFDALKWVPEQCGATFVVEPGRDTKDYVRVGIQELSLGTTVQTTVYTYMGWIKDQGRNVYLHGGGAIGPEGATDAVKVELNKVLARYRLPDPSVTSQEARRAIEAHFRIFGLAKDGNVSANGMAAILASQPYASVLEPCPYTTHFSGSTGSRKTSAAMIALAHFATGMDTRNDKPETSWKSTRASLQRFAYDAQHALLVIDELTGEEPTRIAGDFVQDQGNLKSRDRMQRDLKLSPSLDPRCGVLSTGEADPGRQSALARMLIVRFDQETVRLEKLSVCQTDADAGLYALTMAMFLQWLAQDGRLEAERAQRRADSLRISERLRADLEGKECHPRHPEIIAHLISGYRVFLRFLIETGAKDERTVQAYEDTVQRHLRELVEQQGAIQHGSHPGHRFLELAHAALGSGKYVLKNFGDTSATPPGVEVLGYHDPLAGFVYIAPDLAKSMARKMATASGAHFENPTQLGRDLADAGILTPRLEGKITRFDRKKRIPGVDAFVRYFEIPAAKFYADDISVH